MAPLLLFLPCAAAWLFGGDGEPPPPPEGGGMDMSATFAKLRTCKACVAAGYGWCPNRRKCGGFATEGCGEGENYVAVGEPYDAPSTGRVGGGGSGDGGGGVDMRATFAKYRTCSTCVGAGYGWCTIQRKCGGFANRECGEGERYVSEGMPASRAKPSRNGLWEPKAARAATEEAAKPASVSIEDKAAAAASAAAAQMLHAGPVSPPPQPPSGGGGTDMRAVFAKLKTCTSCVGAGYGWCTIQRKCGGFANRECGAGERYVAEGHEGEAEEAEEAEAAGGMDSGEVGAEEAAADDDFSGLPRVGWKTFKREVMDYEGVVAVQFFAPWCGHCKALKPAWRAAIQELDGAAKLLMVDATKESKLAKRFQVQGYPSIKVFGKNKRAFPTDYQGARTAGALVASLRETAEEEAAKPPAPSPPSRSSDGGGSSSPPSTPPPSSPPPPKPPKRAGPPPTMPRMLRRYELEAMGPKALVDKVLELQDELKAWYEL